MHHIPVVLNQVYVAGSVATFKGDYGTVWGMSIHRIHSTGDAFWLKVNVNACRKRIIYAVKEMKI